MLRKTLIKGMRCAVVSVLTAGMLASPVLAMAEETGTEDTEAVVLAETEAAAPTEETEELSQPLETGVKVTSIDIIGPVTMAVGASQQLSAYVLPENAENKEVEWESGNVKVATVDSKGIVTPKTDGTVTIYARAKDGSGVRGELEITVGAVKVKSILVNGTEKTMVQGGASQQLTVEIEPFNATNPSVSWRTSASSVATVDAAGKVTPVGPGYVDIIAIAKDGSNVEGKFTIEVAPKANDMKSVALGKKTTVNGKTTWEVSATWLANNYGSGYEIEWSKADDFDESWKKVFRKTIKKPSTTALTTTIKKKGTWYFRVRCFKTVKNPETGEEKTLYGAFGKVKSIKLKK